MSRQPTAAAISAPTNFDYSHLERSVAAVVQAATLRIQQRPRKRRLPDVVAIGQDLNQVKRSLSHGQYERWLAAEFSWSDQTALQYRRVAAWLEGKSKETWDVIDVSAANELTAPLLPEAAAPRALELAGKGEHITLDLALQLIAEARGDKHPERAGFERARTKALQQLQRLCRRCPADLVPGLVSEIRARADATEQEQRQGRSTKR